MNSLGTIQVAVAGQSVTALSPSIAGNTDLLQFVSATSTTASPGQTTKLIYTETGKKVVVTLGFTAADDLLSVSVDADQPLVASLDAGPWNAQLSAKSIAVPYYTQNIWFSPTLSRYLNVWWDWRATNATLLQGTSEEYFAKTDGTINRAHEILVLGLSQNLANVLPTIPNPASPYRQQLAGRMIMDVFDNNFATSKQGLLDFGDFDLHQCGAIIHNWQHAGFDNALPEHYTANPDEGGGDGLQAAMSAGTADGCLMALHENYIDYYPNYPAFDESQLALTSTGAPYKGWFNQTTSIQSFQAKPGRMVGLASQQSPMIHTLYNTTASYVDVNSAVGLDGKLDMDAREPGAATTNLWLSSAASLWAFERQAHDGPVFGEGLNHWYYSGLLDGAEAQTGAGSTPMNLGGTLPLFVDFDLLRIHPLQVNHGMGYYERWSQTGSLSLSTAEQDAYRMQEIAFGHAPFLGRTAWAQVPLAIVESKLVSPLATSYALANAAGIQYSVNGAWTDSSTAVANAVGGSGAAAQNTVFSQVQVSYDNGLSVVANAAVQPLSWNSLVIPQYGWAASGPGLRAYTAQCGSSVCDYSETPGAYFANARNQSDARNGWNYALPTLTALTQSFAGTFSFNLNWLVLRAMSTSTNYLAFVHFVDDSKVSVTNEGVVLQGDHALQQPTTSWGLGANVADGPTTVHLLASVPDGTYSIRVGLYDPATGNRLALAGQTDATERIIVGYLKISNGGSVVNFSSLPAVPDDPRLNAAGSVVDFGKIKTDGMVSLERVNASWVLRPYPRSRNFTVLLSKAAFPKPSTIADDMGNTLQPTDAGSYWQVPLDGGKSYSWPAQ